MKYRSDIDGLRAVAVTAVILFHAFPTWLPGGFLGVDVFFVISGFLISRILVEEIDRNDFSLVRFYERRIRRIMPALFATIAVSMLFILLFMYPSATRDAMTSAIFAIFSLSNIYFWCTTDYFGLSVDEKPFLHTWSLGVEEQFYIFFPLILFWVARYIPKRRLQVVLMLFAVSLLISLGGALQTPMATFYGPHARAWELMVGSLLSLNVVRPMQSRLWANILAGLGVLLVAGAVLGFGHFTHIPAYGSLPAVFGAGLMIYSGTGQKTWLTALLSLSPVVFVGKISYSLYLWHWPILKLAAFPLANLLARIPALSGLKASVINLILIAVIFVVGTLSWWFIERPFRKSGAIGRKPLFISAGVAAALLSLVAGVIILSGGWPQRFSPEVMRLAAYTDYKTDYFNEGTCFLSSRYGYDDYSQQQCLHMSETRPNALLVGDSHAAHLWYGLSQSLDANLMQATASGCKPVLDQPAGDRDVCKRLIQYIYRDYLLTHKVDLVVISARWRDQDVADLARTLAWLKAHKIPVVVMGPIVEYQYELPNVLATAVRSHDPALPERLQVHESSRVDQDMARMTARSGVGYVSVYNLICPQGHCMTEAPDGAPMQFDYGHLTREGSTLIGRRIVETGVFAPYLKTSGPTPPATSDKAP